MADPISDLIDGLINDGSNAAEILGNLATSLYDASKAFMNLGDESQNLLIGLEKEKFGLYYSYDITTSNLRKYSSGSHEITISYKFSNQIEN